MPIKIEATCDICNDVITGNNYYEMKIINKGCVSLNPHESITCVLCMEMLRSFIRNGCPKFKE